MLEPFAMPHALRASALLAFVFSGCALFAPDKHLTAAPPPVREQAQASVGTLHLWADTKLPWGAPSDVESWVAPVGLDIENTGDVSIDLRLEDFRLVDDKKRSTAPYFMPIVVSWPVDVDTLRETLRKTPPQGLHNATCVFVTDDRRTDPAGADAWKDEVGRPNVPPRAWEERVRFVGAPRTLALIALTERMLEPRGRLSGYLYFPRPHQDAEQVWLVWRPQGGADELRVPFALK